MTRMHLWLESSSSSPGASFHLPLARSAMGAPTVVETGSNHWTFTGMYGNIAHARLYG